MCTCATTSLPLLHIGVCALTWMLEVCQLMQFDKRCLLNYDFQPVPAYTHAHIPIFSIRIPGKCLQKQSNHILNTFIINCVVFFLLLLLSISISIFLFINNTNEQIKTYYYGCILLFIFNTRYWKRYLITKEMEWMNPMWTRQRTK